MSVHASQHRPRQTVRRLTSVRDLVSFVSQRRAPSHHQHLDVSLGGRGQALSISDWEGMTCAVAAWAVGCTDC
ncbi:hypothetical protein KIPB_011690, partial [Kipferlia bialata]|eukprot:g11690.t1